MKQIEQYYAKIKNCCLYFVSEISKDVQNNKIDDTCYVDDDDDDKSIIFSPEKPISVNSNNVSNKCLLIFLCLVNYYLF